MDRGPTVLVNPLTPECLSVGAVAQVPNHVAQRVARVGVIRVAAFHWQALLVIRPALQASNQLIALAAVHSQQVAMKREVDLSEGFSHVWILSIAHHVDQSAAKDLMVGCG